MNLVAFVSLLAIFGLLSSSDGAIVRRHGNPHVHVFKRRLTCGDQPIPYAYIKLYFGGELLDYKVRSDDCGDFSIDLAQLGDLVGQNNIDMVEMRMNTRCEVPKNFKCVVSYRHSTVQMQFFLGNTAFSKLIDIAHRDIRENTSLHCHE